MTEKNKIDVVQRNVEGLRKEMNSKIESDSKFGQTLAARLAAIVVCKGNIHDYLPVGPILALSLVLVWQQFEFSLFGLGRDLAQKEEKTNKLAGVTLLDYESAFWRDRSRWFGKLKWSRLGLYCSAAPLVFFLIDQLMNSSRLKDSRATEWSTYIVASGILLQIFNVFRRECDLFKANGSRAKPTDLFLAQSRVQQSNHGWLELTIYGL